MINYYSSSAAGGDIKHTYLKSGNLVKNILASLIASMMLFVSCEDDPSLIGAGILPNSDFQNISSVDTFGLNLYARFSDSVPTINPSTAYLGKLNDPFFGETTADFVTQLWLYEYWPENGLNGIDSVKLSLKVSDLIGTMTGINTVNIYEIDEYLSEDSVYYTNHSVPIKQLLGSFELQDVVANDSLITVDMPISWGQEMLRDTTRLFLSNDTADFRNYFNGLYFEYQQSDNNHMIGFNLLDPASTLYVYYLDKNNVKKTFSFLMNDKCIRLNRYQHNFETADADKKIKFINQQQLDTLAYAQSFNGVYTRIEIPGLAGLKDMMPIAINKARVYLPVYIDETSYTEDLIPEQLVARFVDSTGTKLYLPDYELDPVFLDGSYDYLNDRYELNIVNFIQKYLDGDIKEPAFEIFLSGASKKNTILRANGASLSPRIEIVYTDLNQ